MPLDPIPYLTELEQVLDGLASPTTLEVYEAMLPYDGDMVTAAGIERSINGGIGSFTVLNGTDLQISQGNAVILVESNGTVTISINDNDGLELNSFIVGTDGIRAPYLPTSNPGPGLLWNDGNTVKVGT